MKLIIKRKEEVLKEIDKIVYRKINNKSGDKEKELIIRFKDNSNFDYFTNFLSKFKTVTIDLDD